MEVEERPWPDGIGARVEPRPLATRAGARPYGTALGLLVVGQGCYPFKEVHYYRGMLSAAWPANIYSRIKERERNLL